MKKNSFETHLVREFLASPQLMEEFEVDSDLGKDSVEAITELLSQTWRKKPVSLRRRMFHLLEGLESEEEKYLRCCQSAICQGIVGDADQAEKCLLEAAEIDDQRAFHHYIYSLIHGLRGEKDKALFELHLSLERSPSEDSVTRIFEVQEHCAEELSA